MSIYLVIGLLLGLTSSLHCIGMCGPLALSIPVDRSNLQRRIVDNMTYHLGRIIAYAFLGMLIGMIGFSIRLFGWLQGLTILSGLIIILLAWKQYLPFKTKAQGVYTFFGNSMRHLRKLRGSKKLFLLGSLNGILPCGMVFAALTNAVLAENLAMSSLSMIAFGLGTFPALLLFNILSGKFSLHINRKLVPVFVSIIGLLIVFRGLNLGIPYLSPKLKPAIVQEQENCKPTMSCCHK